MTSNTAAALSTAVVDRLIAGVLDYEYAPLGLTCKSNIHLGVTC